MPSMIEAKKAALVGTAQQLADGETEAERAALRRFIAQLYEHAPPSDVALRGAADLYGAALALWRFAAGRRPGTAKLRVYNPDAAADGWSSPHTIVEIVNDDMPFLVDSVTAAISHDGREVRLAIHPILAVARDDAADIVALDPPCGGLRESWMQIAISREPDPAECTALAAQLSAVLADVRIAVSDWHRMRETLQAIADAVAAEAPPLPSAEIAEGVDFLRWLDDDNFTYLGFREYPVPGAVREVAATARPALGILAEAHYSVFGGLRDLAALPIDVQRLHPPPRAVDHRQDRPPRHRAPRRATWTRSASAASMRPAMPCRCCCSSASSPRSPTAAGRTRSRCCGRRYAARSSARRLAPDSHDGKALIAHPRNLPARRTVPDRRGRAARHRDRHPQPAGAPAHRAVRPARPARALCLVPRLCAARALRHQPAAELRRDPRARPSPATVADFYAHLDESVLARVQFIIRGDARRGADGRRCGARAALAEAGRSWADRVEEAAAAAFGELPSAHRRLRRLQAVSGRLPGAHRAGAGDRRSRSDRGGARRLAAGSLAASAAAGRRRRRHGAAALPPRASRWRCPTCCRCWKISACGSSPRSRSASTAWTAARCGSTNSRSAPGRCPPRSRPRRGGASRRRWSRSWAGAIENDGFNRLVLAAGLSARQAIDPAALLQGAAPGRLAPSARAYMEDTLARPRGDRAPPGAAVRAPLRPGRAAPTRRRDRRGAGDRARARRGREPRRGPHPARLPDARPEDRCAPTTSSAAPSGEPKPYLAVKLASQRDRPVAAAAPALRDLRLQPAHGGGAHARRQGRARRHPLVRPPGGFPHRDPRPDEGADGEERGHRAGRLERRLCREARRA